VIKTKNQTILPEKKTGEMNHRLFCYPRVSRKYECLSGRTIDGIRSTGFSKG